ncbi:unnamed protein product [Adineta steineri]|uniref:Arrestin-like N-terminal domain-containing protein n=1 Tax=Adineta steineri TaxID=433720 RepID=A0A815U326_9BILA|nr:unnamed protein product [Adineta steineri]
MGCGSSSSAVIINLDRPDPFYFAAHPPAGQKELTYGRGLYTFPFQFQLPNNLPPSLNPHVRYYVQMYVDKAWYKANTQENKYITIYPHVNIKKTPNFLQPTMFGDQNRKDIVVQGTLQITVSMFKNYRIANSTHDEVVTSSTISELMNRKQPKLNGTFSILVHTTENASYSQKLHIPALPSELK